MGISDYTRIILDKIQKFEPENATKIIGYLLLHDLGEQELAKLASYPDHMICEIACKAKTKLQNLAAKSAILSSSPPINPRPAISHLPIISPRTTAPSPSSFQVHPSKFWETQSSANNINPEFMSMIDPIPEHQKQTRILRAENHIDPSTAGAAGIANDYFTLDASNVNLNGKSGRKFGSQNLAAKSAILSSSPPINPQPAISHLPIISPGTIAPSPSSFQVHPFKFWETQSSANNINPESMSMGFIDPIPELQKQTRIFCAENHIDPSTSGAAGIANDYFTLDASNMNLNGKSGRKFGSSEFPVKICHYFIKGCCKHGSSCRYFHGQLAPESFSQMNGNGDDQGGSTGSLAQLEVELIELLRPRRGNPISIASLPMAYYEKYNKVLQAEGYLTESQRHGKSGYSLTKLLARLKNNIQLIDRPHGQHAVVLVEDRYLERGDPSQNINASRQIYLTFPSDSTFTEQDVSDYFNSFGQVEDVRIPSQEKRMFGFVTFVDPETVKMILEKGNPHYVHGSRVLVKPYRERSQLVERKHSERVEPAVVCSLHHVDMDFELNPMPSYGNPRFLRRRLVDEQEQALEFQRRQLAELQLTPKPLSSSPHFGCSFDQFNVSSDHFNFRPSEFLNYGLNLNDKSGHTDTSCADEDRGQGIDLPDSPFSFPVDSGISTMI